MPSLAVVCLTSTSVPDCAIRTARLVVAEIRPLHHGPKVNATVNLIGTCEPWNQPQNPVTLRVLFSLVRATCHRQDVSIRHLSDLLPQSPRGPLERRRSAWVDWGPYRDALERRPSLRPESLRGTGNLRVESRRS
jgi:hypothetical protein